MNILKFVAIGAVVAYGVNYLTKRDSAGRSIVDDLLDKAPGLADNLKKYGEDALSSVKSKVQG